MNSDTPRKIYWVLMTISVLVTSSYWIWKSQQPSEEEVQQRMQEGRRSQQIMEEVRAMEERRAEQNRAFGANSTEPKPGP